ncbi:MAG: hypothetical protein EA411_08280 [Saprospirales bacterium]|nr:MAG: hypothetical protein EA411_08280 [Saprospirales bacterium]
MASRGSPPKKLKRGVKFVERAIIVALVGLMSFLLLIATLELFYAVYLALLENKDKTLLINLDNMLNIFGIFLLVLIGIELLDTIKVYFKENVIHVEVVILVALIAIARKVIVLDFDYYSGIEILGISSIILSLAGGYYLLKKTGSTAVYPKVKKEVEEVVIQDPDDEEKTVKKIKKKEVEKPTDKPDDDPKTINPKNL